MGQPLGQRQIEYSELLLKRKRPLDADELARLIYKKQPTKTLQNIMWSALRGMERRRMIQPAGMSHKGFGRWELTKQGRKDIEVLKSTENVSPFPG